MGDSIKLIKVTYTRSAQGVAIPHETSREVLVTINDITRAEFTAANQLGLVPSVQAETDRSNYEGETIAEWRGTRYAIYRTYRIPNTSRIELYLERRAGVYGQGD